MIRLLRSLFYRSPRVARWQAVRHLDANDRRRREVIAENRHEVLMTLHLGPNWEANRFK